MQERAIKQAKERLSAAEVALTKIEKAVSLQDMESAWHDLLVAASTVYSKLEQGSKGSGPSEAWFGRRKNERKSDPLLQYVHQARNSAEHSIEEVARGAEVSVSIGAGDLKPGESFGLAQTPDGYLVPATTGDPTKLQVRGRHVRLVSVQNRGATFDPPKTHLGQVVGYEADDVGRHLIVYLKRMISDAETLILS